MRITRIQAREILDSRGLPTVEADVELEDGAWGRAAVPSGASTGQFEALELRDGDQQRFLGKGVRTAVQNIHEKIAPALLAAGPLHDQAACDALLKDLDGTENKSQLGANALLAVSLAFSRARANHFCIALSDLLDEKATKSLPVPLMNVINGGAHADNALSVQEFMIVPFGFPTFSEALRCGAEVFHTLKALFKQQGLSTNVGDEGGFAPALTSTRHALDCLMEAIQKAGYQAGKQVALALDVAASELYHDEKYDFPEERLAMTSDQLIMFYEHLTADYPIISIEDGLSDDDITGWKALTQTLGNQIQLVGDDLFVTNPRRFSQGIEDGLANAILVKVNQIGTLSEAIETIHLAKAKNYQTIVSHRSGETEDVFIADLAVSTGAGQIKTGSLARSDRVAKYNQLLRLEEAWKGELTYAGENGFAPYVLQRILGK